MTIDDIIDAKLGTTQVMAIYMGAEKVWPRNFVVTYAIDASSITIEYSEGAKLYANGSNYAAFYANILEYHDGVYDHTNTHQRLTVSLPESTIFYIENNTVKGYNLGAEGYGERNSLVYVTYDTLEPISGGYVGQEANTPTVDSYAYNDVEGTPYVDGYTDSDYFVSITSDRYTSTSTAAPASGTTSSTRAYLTVVAYHNQTEIIRTPWTRYKTPTYVWTSGATSVGEASVDSQWSVQSSGSTERVNDSATITGGGSSTGFTRSGNYVSVASEGTTQYTAGRNTYFYAQNGTATASVRLFQAKNVITETIPTSETQWGIPVVTVTDHSYVVTFDLSQYKTAANPAPARGGYAMIILGGSHTRTTETATDWATVSYNTYVWSSGARSYNTPTVTDSGTDRDYENESIVDTPTVAFSSSHDGFTLGDGRVEAANRGTTAGAARSAQLVATNGDASASVTVYQALNRIESTSYSYRLSVDIDVSGNISYLGGLFSVDYESWRTPTNTYSSGDSEVLSEVAYAASVSASGATAETASVSGSGSFVITVMQNQTQLIQVVDVTLAQSGGSTASDFVNQEAAPAVVTANVYPVIDAATGLPRLHLKVTNGSVTFPVTLTAVKYHYILSGTTEEVIINVRGTGSVTVSADDVNTNIVGPPSFSTSVSGVHWFSATSVSGFELPYVNFRHDNFAWVPPIINQ